MASTPMRTAPARATNTTESMPGTQAAVAVDRAIMSVSSRMRTADQATAPVIEARVRLQNLTGHKAARPLADADCISSPHQPREVVTATDDVKVDILPQVEARVSIRATEAGGVEIENNHVRTPALNRLKKAYPLGVGAWRDHRRGASWQPANSIPCKGLGQRCPSIGLGDGEIVQDQPVLPHRPVRLEDRALRIIGDEAYLPAPAVNLRCHRRGQAYTVLEG